MSRLLQSLYITIVSIGLFALLAAIIPGIDMFEPISRALTDVTITDIHYASMREAKPVEVNFTILCSPGVHYDSSRHDSQACFFAL